MPEITEQDGKILPEWTDKNVNCFTDVKLKKIAILEGVKIYMAMKLKRTANTLEERHFSEQVINSLLNNDNRFIVELVKE